MSGRGTFRARWRREVWRTQRVSDSVRVLLLLLADDMAENGRVSLPRSELARRLGRTPRRVTERLQMACDVGLLDRVQTGKPGATAVYAAVLPTSDGAPVRTPAKGADSGTSPGAHVRTLDTSAHVLGRPGLDGADGGPAIGKRESPQLVGFQRARVPGEERSSEGQDDPWKGIA
jgi:hypothetical protein